MEVVHGVVLTNDTAEGNTRSWVRFAEVAMFLSPGKAITLPDMCMCIAMARWL